MYPNKHSGKFKTKYDQVSPVCAYSVHLSTARPEVGLKYRYQISDCSHELIAIRCGVFKNFSKTDLRPFSYVLKFYIGKSLLIENESSL